MVAKNRRMSSFPLPGQSLSVMAQIEARKQMQQKSSSFSSDYYQKNSSTTNNNIHTATSDDSFTSLANRRRLPHTANHDTTTSTTQQQQHQEQFTSLNYFPQNLQSRSISSSCDDSFDIDHQIVKTDSSTSTFTGLLNSINNVANNASLASASVEESLPHNHHHQVEEEEEDVHQVMEEEVDEVMGEEDEVGENLQIEGENNNKFAAGGIIDRNEFIATATRNYFAQEEIDHPPPPIADTTTTTPHEEEDHHLIITEEIDALTQYTTEDGEEIVYRGMKLPTSSRRSHVDDDHRDDDAYETDDYSASVNEDDDDEETEAEEDTTVGEFTEAEDDEDDDDTSVGTAHTGDSLNTLMVDMEHNEVSLREVVIDTTSMDRDTAEELGQLFPKNTSISTIRLSCKRLGCKEGRTRKHHILSTLLSGIKENTAIESIEIEDMEISHELAHHLSQLCARKQSLKNIAMIQCQFVGSGLAILFLGMQHSQSIRNVIFQSCDLGNVGQLDNGGGNDALQQQQQQESSFNVEIIASAIPLMHLTSLSLVDVHFPTEECLHYLLKNIEYAKDLKLLDLSQNRLDGRSIALLSKSIKKNQISRLVLSNCSLDNGSIKELAIGLRGYDPLTNLDVSKNKHVGDRGAMNIKDLLKANSKILKLNVSGCSFSESSLDALEAALRYNNSFLKTFVSVSTGQQIFDVVDAIANLGVGGDDDEEEEDEDDDEDVKDRRSRGGSSSKHHGDDHRRRRAMDRGKQPSRTSKKSNKSPTLSPTADRDRDWGDNSGRTSPPKRDDMRSLFDTSFDKRSGNISSPPQRDAKVYPSMHVQKVPRSPPPPPPPPPPPLPRQQDISQSAKDSASVRRNSNIPMTQFFDDQVNFEDKSSSHSVQSGAKYASPRPNGNTPVHQFNSTDEFFPSGSGQDFTTGAGGPQYKSPRKSSNPTMPQYEFSSTSSSQSGTFKPSRQDIRSAKYVSQRKNAVQQKAPKIDEVIAQLSPSRRDIARSPRSPRSSTTGSSTSGKRVML